MEFGYIKTFFPTFIQMISFFLPYRWLFGSKLIIIVVFSHFSKNFYFKPPWFDKRPGTFGYCMTSFLDFVQTEAIFPMTWWEFGLILFKTADFSHFSWISCLLLLDFDVQAGNIGYCMVSFLTFIQTAGNSSNDLTGVWKRLFYWSD